MNVYLDIDETLRANENFAAEYADEYLQAVLAKYPDSTYWLTTHCWQGENRAMEVLTPLLRPETVRLLHKIKPTDWEELKTDAIDFTRPFLWFDDELWEEERVVLQAHDALEGHVQMDLGRKPAQLRELAERYFK